MGKKSRQKRIRRLSHNPDIFQCSYLNFFTSILIAFFSGFLIWAIFLLEKTMIHINVIFSVLIPGLICGVLLFKFLIRKFNFPIFVTIFYGFLIGSSISLFSFTGLNYFFRSNEKVYRIFDITQSGNLTRRKSLCKTPYIKFNDKGIEKELKFSCEYESNIRSFKKVNVGFSKGLLGFYIILDKQLIQ